MTKENLKPIYAENNLDWRIRYHANSLWELQEYHKLPNDTDRSREQEWIIHNRFMSYDDAIKCLGSYVKRKGA